MAFWRQEKKGPELFSWQTLSDEEKALIIAAVKEELHQVLENEHSIEKALENLFWEDVQSEDEITIEYSYKCNIPALRGMIRVMKATRGEK